MTIAYGALVHHQPEIIIPGKPIRLLLNPCGGR